MSMKKWAENEVKLACIKENPDRKEGEFDYGCACYESALKAFNSLLEDGHSRMSIGFTKNILNRLIDGKPLTPIKDIPEVWSDAVKYRDDNYTTYQCLRMGSLFKYVYDDGNVKYKDVDRVICIDINNPTVSFKNGFVSNLVDDMYPITMPYYPSAKPIIVYREDCLTDPKNVDFDTIAIYYLIMPDGERIEINRYFKENETSWDEISVDEWNDRKAMRGWRK